MSGVGNFNTAAKRTALADRNVAPRDAGDAPYDAKSVSTQNYTSTSTSTIVVSKAQENRIQTKSKNTLTKAFFQPAQRPPKVVAPSVSMSQLKPATNGNTHILRKAISRASMPPFVFKDAQGPESKLAPAASARATSKDGPPAVQATKVQPSTKNSNIKQEPSADPASQKMESVQPEQRKRQDQQDASRYSKHEVVQHQKPAYLSSKPSLLIPPGDAPPPISPRADDDITEPLYYVDAVEDLSQEQIQFLANAPSQFIDAPEPHRPASSLPEPLVPEHRPERVNPTRPSGAQPEVSSTNQPLPSFYLDPGYLPYLSDCDDDDEEEEEDDHCYDDRGYTTAHSYRSRGDNTTSGVTTVMLPPKITKKGQAELEAARRIVESRRTAEDVLEDDWDVSMVAEYGDDIFHYMKELEMALLPNPHYMDNQGEIQWSMRSVLMDWVVQVHTRFGLLPETLFLTVNYIDRFLSRKIVSLGKLQLVGATAILIAAKYEEINCPSVQEIVYMVDGGYTVEEILKAERFMLSMLDFELGWPGPMSFLRRISKADDYDLEARTLAKYFLEVVIMDERFVASPPSYIAAGAHCLSRFILRKGEWTPPHVYYSGYTYQQLKPLVTMLLDCCRHARKHHSAVFEKYSDKRYRHASTYVEEEIMRGFTLPFEQRVSLAFSVDFFAHETARASYAGSHPGSHSMKMPIPTHG
ncbi:cyclin-like protein [Nemania serpens]|nr:cyclin-like protein [Nemania serpens]